MCSGGSFSMRSEIAICAGARGWGDTRLSWLGKVPAAVKDALGTKHETVSFRTVKSLWYGAISDPEHHAARDIRRAAEIIAARRGALALAVKYRALARGYSANNPDLYREEI